MTTDHKPQTGTLAEFLLARIAEDEAVARDEIARQEKWPAPAGAAYAVTMVDIITPARVLAECDAKRRIVELHGRRDDDTCAECGDGEPDTGPGDRGWFEAAHWPCLTLQLLALPYADHPDFQEQWKP